ncbi:MAG TPA: hypothetical protein VFV34_03210 [Blastocatellia bacterium]|nr:hypothetical protein [Blastocatellia bacterium]
MTDEVILRAYLLGDLAEDEHVRQEERLLTDKDYFERLLLVEDDLMDEYVSGLLAPAEREKVEKRFLLSPSRQAKIELAANLQRYASELPTAEPALRARRFLPVRASLVQRSPRASALLVWAAFLVVAVGVVVVVQLMMLTRRLDSLEGDKQAAARSATELSDKLGAQAARSDELARKLEQETERRTQLEEETANLKRLLSQPPGSNQSGLLALSLSPGRLRDGGPTRVIEISPAVRVLVLQLSIGANRYRSYRAVLRNDEGVVILAANNLRVAATSYQNYQDGKKIELRVPARLLRPGDYTILLSPANSQERTGTYYFTAKRQK